MEVTDILIVSVTMILIPFKVQVLKYLKVQLIEQAYSNNLEKIGNILWDKESYWQSPLFTIVKGNEQHFRFFF